MTEDRAEDLTKSASGATGEPQPPAPNQHKDEQIATSPSESPQSSDTSAADTDSPAEQSPDPQSAVTTGGVPTPGDSKGVSVPSVQAAAGTSEESSAVRMANAPPGKPDGEVDTRA